MEKCKRSKFSINSTQNSTLVIFSPFPHLHFNIVNFDIFQFEAVGHNNLSDVISCFTISIIIYPAELGRPKTAIPTL